MGKIIKIFFILFLSMSYLKAENYCTNDIVLIETLDGQCPTNYHLLEFKNYELSNEVDQWFDITIKNFCYGLKEQTKDCKEIKLFNTEVYEEIYQKLEFNKPEYKTKNNCNELFQDLGVEKSGFYMIKNNLEVYCDMDYNGGGWIDVVKTLKRHPEYLKVFFYEKGIVGNPIYDTNPIGEEGIYITYAIGTPMGLYFDPSILFQAKEVAISWVLQAGGSKSYCNNSTYSAMTGPGYEGGPYTYTETYGVNGKEIITGKMNYYQDKAIEGEYINEIGSNQILAWYGVNRTNSSDSCHRSYKIPTNKPSLWFEKLKIR